MSYSTLTVHILLNSVGIINPPPFPTTTTQTPISIHMPLLVNVGFPLTSPPPSVQNIDTDQIIPAEYLTLVPSKVRPLNKCTQKTQ